MYNFTIEVYHYYLNLDEALRHEKPDSTYYVAFDSFQKEHSALRHASSAEEV